MAQQYLVFRVDDQRHALDLDRVDRVVRAAEVTPLPDAPPVVVGAVTVRGTRLPVLDLRGRFGVVRHGVDVSDQFIVARAGGRQLLLVANGVEGVVTCGTEAVIDAGRVLPSMPHVRGVAKTDAGMLLVDDLDRVLSPDEAKRLDAAMAE